MYITPEELIRVIHSVDSKASCRITNRGTAPNMGNLQRYIVETHLYGADIQIGVGENVILHINGSPRAVLQYGNLANPKTILETVRKWILRVEEFLKRRELPLVRHLAESALGKELSTDKKQDSIRVTYDCFSIIITPELAAMSIKSTGRICLVRNYTNIPELEKFFQIARLQAQAIRTGHVQ
jgi:hypothetical protein